MKVVESRLAGSVLASIYLTMMRADESLHHLMGNLCQASGRKVLESLCELLTRVSRVSEQRRLDSSWMAMALERSFQLRGVSGKSVRAKVSVRFCIEML